MTKYTEKRENINKAIEAIEEGVKALFEDEKYKQYLKNMAMFHEYSYGNVVLIASQCPTATMVAGYNTWQALNRHVKKGEKAIRIIAPMIYNKKEKEDDENNTKVYYKTVSVFDISQTEGAELKNPCMRELVDSCKDFKSLFEILKGITPCSVGFEEMTNTNGYFNRREKVIRIKEGMSESQTIKTFIHEIAHSILHDGYNAKDNEIKPTQNGKEVEAESVAFVVCNALGIDSSSYSFGYIASWSKDKELKELKASLSRISKASNEIITKIEKALKG